MNGKGRCNYVTKANINVLLRNSNLKVDGRKIYVENIYHHCYCENTTGGYTKLNFVWTVSNYTRLYRLGRSSCYGTTVYLFIIWRCHWIGSTQGNEKCLIISYQRVILAFILKTVVPINAWKYLLISTMTMNEDEMKKSVNNIFVYKVNAGCIVNMLLLRTKTWYITC